MNISYKVFSKEKDFFESMVNSYIQKGIKPEDLKSFICLLWEKSHPDERPFLIQDAGFRLYWSMRWLNRLVSLGLISRATAYRALELLG